MKFQCSASTQYYLNDNIFLKMQKINKEIQRNLQQNGILMSLLLEFRSPLSYPEVWQAPLGTTWIHTAGCIVEDGVQAID